MRIGIDWDGVIVERKGIPRYGDFANCEPVKDAKEALWFLVGNHDVYIFTNRPKKDWGKIKWWLDKWSFPKVKVTNIKQPDTAIYLDDRAIRFTNWMDITKLIG